MNSLRWNYRNTRSQRPPANVALAGGIVLLTILGCTTAPDVDRPGSDVESPFHDAAQEAGLIFRHDNGMIGQRYILEIMGPGSALIDFDRDGDLDVFLIQGQSLHRDALDSTVADLRHRLFRNDLTIGPGGVPALKFTDVTDAAGLAFSDYGMGVIAGDFDSDGNTDLYVTCYGRNRLLRNTGRQSFVDVTDAAGLDSEPAWSSSASWADFDRDGHLDLFVCQYLDWTIATHVACQSPWGGQGYCGPKIFPPSRSRLYRNQGDGTFVNISDSSQVSGRPGAALGVVGADLNDDGWVDFFVANDAMPNHLWINRQDGTFADEALIRGCAVNGEGMSEGNMGIIAADFFNQGRLDLFITHLKSEHATFFQNLGEGYFADVTAPLGLDAATRAYTGFGTGAIDYDNDGALDIFVTNGGVQIDLAQDEAGVAVPLRQRSLLFRNGGRSQLEFAAIEGFPFLDVEEVGRGAAFGDLDNDGDLDVIVNNNHGPARLLLNDVGQKKHWLGLRLVAGAAGAEFDVLGAVAQLERPGRPTLTRRCATDGSYLSSSDPRLIFGLGDSPESGTIRVRWPDGEEQVWENLPSDRYHILHRSGVSDGKSTLRTARRDSTGSMP